MCEVDRDQTGTRGVRLLFLVSPFLVTVSPYLSSNVEPNVEMIVHYKT
jgi:hypothetical protein